MASKFLIDIENGKASLAQLAGYLSTKPDGPYIVTVQRMRPKRTASQNEWLWGCVYPMLLDALIDAGWEFTDTKQVHEFFKAQLAEDKVVNKETGEIVSFPRSTALMDTATFSAYCEKLREYAREFLNTEIPDPDKLWKCR